MLVKRLVFIAVAFASLLLPTKVSAVETESACTLESIDQTTDRLQWQDVAMCDMLVVTGGSSVAPPTTVRVVHDSPSGTTTSTTSAQLRRYRSLRLAACGHRPIVSGYIYLIRSLRL